MKIATTSKQSRRDERPRRTSLQALAGGRLRLALLAFGLIALTTLALHAYARLKESHLAVAEPPRAAIGPAPAARPAARTAGAPQKPQLTDSVLVTVTARGFDTPQITTPAKPFFLLVDNRSGLDEVALRLDQVGGPRLRSVDVPQEQLDWADLLDLAPGEYVLSEANHPDWSCRLTITAQ
jgi:hypothetical protein